MIENIIESNYFQYAAVGIACVIALVLVIVFNSLLFTGLIVIFLALILIVREYYKYKEIHMK